MLRVNKTPFPWEKEQNISREKNEPENYYLWHLSCLVWWDDNGLGWSILTPYTVCPPKSGEPSLVRKNPLAFFYFPKVQILN